MALANVNAKLAQANVFLSIGASQPLIDPIPRPALVDGAPGAQTWCDLIQRNAGSGESSMSRVWLERQRRILFLPWQPLRFQRREGVHANVHMFSELDRPGEESR